MKQTVEDSVYVEEDFYSLLGVSPLADTKEIKKAYYSMMRTCHPDRSVDLEATEFCALLNDVYQTLSDPVRRALYDELAGFSSSSINPFLDDRYPRDRAFVDEFSCIGCRNCNNVCPKTFGMEEEYGRARVMQQDVDTEEKIQEAIDTCPVSCIHWVTAPQLSLLESAMTRMERIAVWSMMGGAGANKDVFVEASLAWTKRQSEIRRRVQEASMSASAPAPEAQTTGWNFWGFGGKAKGKGTGAGFDAASGSQFYSEAERAREQQRRRQQEQEQQAAGANGDRDTRSVADLAARAARAARTWRRFQEVTQASRAQRFAITSLSSASLSSVTSVSSMDAE